MKKERKGKGEGRKLSGPLTVSARKRRETGKKEKKREKIPSPADISFGGGKEGN